MHAKVIMVIGLLLSLVSVVILFFVPYPAPDSESEMEDTIVLDDANFLPSGKTAGQARDDREKKKKMFKRVSRAAFVIMLAGFALQLWSVLITP
jgi:hypothetical protein